MLLEVAPVLSFNRLFHIVFIVFRSENCEPLQILSANAYKSILSGCHWDIDMKQKCYRMPQWTCGSHGEQCPSIQNLSLAVWLFWCRHTVLVESRPFCMVLDLRLSFYCPLCYNSRAHCPLLQCLCTTSAILAGALYYFVVPSFKCEGKNSYIT